MRIPSFVLVVSLVTALAPTPHVATAATAAIADSLVGTWTGTVTAPQGSTRLTLAFDRDSAGDLRLTLDMPVMHCHAYRFEPPVARVEGTWRFDPLDLRWTIVRGRLEGTFGLGRLPMTLRPGGHVTPPPRVPRMAAGPAPLWRYALGAPSRATPVVRDGIVYVGASNGALHAVRAADGSRLWCWTGPHPIDAGARVTDDAVLLVDRALDLVCIDRASGALRWRFALHDSVRAGGPAPANATFTRRVSTPLVLDGVVYAGSSDGGLYALDAASGGLLWRHEAHTPIFSAIGRVGGDTLAFGGMDGSLVLFDRAARRELVRVHTAGPIVTTPVVVAGHLVAGSRDYQVHAFDLADTTRGWRYSYWFSWVESTPAVVGGTLWVGASDFRRVTAFDAASGRVRWSTDVLGMSWGTPVVTANEVIVATAAQNFPGTVIDHAGGIVALDRASGRIRWRWAAPTPAVNALGGFAGSLALAGDRVVGAGFDGQLVALPLR